MKTILSVTGTRADYGIWKPVFDAIRSSKHFRLELLVTGMHLLPEFGMTVKEIRKDGFTIAAEVATMTTEDTKQAMATYIGQTIVGCAKVFAERCPDVVFLLGDRSEQLAAAVAARELGIPIAHLHGGEQTGSVDDAMRHAITMMADIHFTTAASHSDRVRAMRPDTKHIYTVGAPGLDVVRTFKPIPKEELFKTVKFDAKLPTLLFVQHPDTLEPRSPEEQIAPSIEALGRFTGNILIIGANADAGGMHFNKHLHMFAQTRKYAAFCITVPHREFLSWLKIADVLVGNSSSGIIEAASFKLPVVNIGDRQKGRLRSGNVLDVPYNVDAIRSAIAKAQSKAFLGRCSICKNVYGTGHAAEKIVRTLIH